MDNWSSAILVSYRICLPVVSTSIAKTSVSQTSIAKMSSISSIGRSSIGSVSMVDRGGVGGSGHNSNIVGVSSSIGIVDWETSCNLSNGVGISIRVSFGLTLAIVVSRVSMDGWGSISMNTRVSIGSMGIGRSSIGSVSMVDRGRVGGSGHNSNIVGVSSSIRIVDGETSSNLSNSVGISIRVSLTLAIVVSGVSVDRCGGKNAGVHGGSSNYFRVSSRGSNNMVSVSEVSNTSISNMSSIGTVTNSSNTTDNTIRVINTSYYTSIGQARCNLSNGVGVTVSMDGSSQKDKCKSSHLDIAEQSS